MLNRIWQNFKAWWANAEQLAKKDISELWNNYRAFIIPLLALLAVIKFRDIVISILVSSAKRIFQNQQSKSDQLQGKENAYNQQANDLVKQAEDLSKQQPHSNNDWYKNEK